MTTMVVAVGVDGLVLVSLGLWAETTDDDIIVFLNRHRYYHRHRHDYCSFTRVCHMHRYLIRLTLVVHLNSELRCTYIEIQN